MFKNYKQNDENHVGKNKFIDAYCEEVWYTFVFVSDFSVRMYILLQQSYMMKLRSL